jgi:hypothetical protein
VAPPRFIISKTCEAFWSALPLSKDFKLGLLKELPTSVTSQLLSYHRLRVLTGQGYCIPHRVITGKHRAMAALRQNKSYSTCSKLNNADFLGKEIKLTSPTGGMQ